MIHELYVFYVVNVSSFDVHVFYLFWYVHLYQEDVLWIYLNNVNKINCQFIYILFIYYNLSKIVNKLWISSGANNDASVVAIGATSSIDIAGRLLIIFNSGMALKVYMHYTIMLTEVRKDVGDWNIKMYLIVFSIILKFIWLLVWKLVILE